MTLPFDQQKKNIAKINDFLKGKRSDIYEFIEIPINYNPNNYIMRNRQTGEELWYSAAFDTFQYKSGKDEILAGVGSEEAMKILKAVE